MKPPNGMCDMARRGIAALLFLPLGGCQIFENVERLTRENLELHEKVTAQQNELIRGQERVDALTEQAATLQGRGPLQFEKLYHPVGLRFARLTGGHDYDRKPGDDGITIYLQPIDEDGHVVKVPGTITVELFDLANPDGQRTIFSRRYTVDEVRSLWSGRWMTQHYTLKCPWPENRLPAHRDITVRVTFIDYLSGRSLTMQDVFAIRFPPEHTSARRE